MFSSFRFPSQLKKSNLFPLYSWEVFLFLGTFSILKISCMNILSVLSYKTKLQDILNAEATCKLIEIILIISQKPNDDIEFCLILIIQEQSCFARIRYCICVHLPFFFFPAGRLLNKSENSHICWLDSWIFSFICWFIMHTKVYQDPRESLYLCEIYERWDKMVLFRNQYKREGRLKKSKLHWRPCQPWTQ